MLLASNHDPADRSVSMPPSFQEPKLRRKLFGEDGSFGEATAADLGCATVSNYAHA